VRVEAELVRFAEDLQQQVISEAEADPDGLFREEVFTQRMIDFLAEFGEIDDAVTCQYRKRGMRLSGYSIGQDEQTLDLIVSHCDWEIPPAVVSRSTVSQLAREGRTFLAQCLKGYHKKMEPATPAYDLALRIYELGPEIGKVRILVVTDGIVKSVPLPDDDLDGISLGYQVWDIERVYRCATSGSKREPILIDFTDFGGPIPCLELLNGGDRYKTYLAIVPGSTLAAIYERWGTRLLEKNVRSFLQARGKVNQGIRNTILKEPEMFLTYNNGISVTAERAETIRLGQGPLAISQIEDFQIVNGGQTTASLYHAKRKDRADLSKISLQMKLTVVKTADAMEEVVPLISKYANTQNRVSVADFSSNDPFHREVEALSRTTWAPDPSGGKRLTHWFYERARGQYYDEKNRSGTPAMERAFESINPRSQVFTKTDLAKFENTWNQFPHVVSRGAQKNFADFMVQLKERGGFKVDQDYFEELVAKAIMFRKSEKVVSARDFGGYRANIVTYTCALVSFISERRVDLGRVWAEQDLHASLKSEIDRLSIEVQKHIISPPGGQNVTEWCKKEECWTTLLAKRLELSAELRTELLDLGPAAFHKQEGIQGDDEGDARNIAEVRKLGGATWLELSSWAKVTNTLDGWQRGIVYAVGDRLRKGRDPSRKQAKQALIALKKAEEKGFKPSKSEG
jgi:hypothetical protein